MRNRLGVWLVLVLAISLSGALVAQTVSTQILGLVTDPTGSVVPGAIISAKRVATGDVRTTQSNETGNYVFPLLEIGEYEVTCAAAGFKTEVRRGIILELQQKLRIDFQLQVGQQVETVEVTGQTPLLRTEDATLGAVVESRRIVDLALNGRNFAQLALLAPGVTFGYSRMGLDGAGGGPIPGQVIAISANGQRDINQHITLDGVIATEPRVNTMTFTPSIEAIEEFKIQSAVYSAEFGMNSGAQISVAIKSGTNTLHGTAYEFIRNNALDARGFFLPATQKKNKLRRNEYGGVASGPLIKDRTFWMGAVEYRRERRATPSLSTVPTLAMRRGDFSELLIPGNRWYRTDANPAVTRAIRAPGSTTPFPNNMIPASMINRVATGLLTNKEGSPFADGGYISPPNQDRPGDAINLGGTNDTLIDADQYLGRIDHKFSDSDRIFGRYIIQDSKFGNKPLLGVNFQDVLNRSQNLAIGYSRILSATMVNDFRFGYNRTNDITVGMHTNTNFQQTSVGLDFRVVGDNNRTYLPFEAGLPNITITGFAGIPIPSTNGWINEHHIWEYADNVTWSRGTHNFKFGGVYRFNFVDRAAANWPRGQLGYSRDIVGIPDAFAAFMLGFPTTGNTSEGVAPLFARQNKFGFYWLDDWKVTPRLTINYGVRYDLFGVVTDAKGRFRNVSFAEGEGRVIGGRFVPQMVPNPDVTAKLWDINKLQIMPRLGIAYRYSDTWVLRMGAGQFYNAQQINNFSILNLHPPYSGSKNLENDRTNPVAAGPLSSNPNPGSSPDDTLMLGNLQASNRNRPLYLNNDIWQWTTEIEKSLGHGFVTGIAYVGSKASNIDITIANFNNPDPGLGNIQNRRPYPFYTDSRNPNVQIPLGIIRQLDTSQNAFYHALQARAEKRYGRLILSTTYNFQKAIAVGYGANEGAGFNTNQTQDPRNTQSDYGRSNIDQRHRLVVNELYEFPWMRDQKGVGRLLGGWSITGTFVLQSGLPVTVAQTGDSHNTGARSAARPHLAPGAKVVRVMDGRSIARWFDTSAFIRSKCDGCPGEGVFIGPLGYGDSGVGLFDAPAQKNWTFALFKDFRVREGHRVQFRWESFNFTNTPQFSAPDRNFGNPTFGRILSTITGNREMQFGLKYIF
ncbi:MAG: TonB-dependent receptor [Acidobacteria bacterium]|nr:TonB-dependent receptor [Acidobacteriota bacterium]